jgi:tight adherence protein C
MEQWMSLLAALTLGISCYLFFLLLKRPSLARSVAAVLPEKWKKTALLSLWRAGAPAKDDVLFGRILLGLGLSILFMLLLPAPLHWIPFLLLILGLTLFGQKYRLRQDQVAGELIYLASSLSLSVAGGQDFSLALAHYTEEEEGFLPEECRQALGRLRLGQDRSIVFDPLVSRYPVTREFFNALKMSEKQGTPLSKVLSDQANRWRQNRLFKAEAAAQRLPVLLMGPLALCVFPSVILALLGPFLIDLF